MYHALPAVDGRGARGELVGRMQSVDRVPDPPPACEPELISKHALIKWFLQSHFTHKAVDLLYTIPYYEIGQGRACWPNAEC